MADDAKNNVSRRTFVKGAAGTVGAVATFKIGETIIEPTLHGVELASPMYQPPFKLIVNGKEQIVPGQDYRTLLLAIRDDLNLTGTKKGCNMGQCGACTILLDGEPVYSCMMLARDAEGKKITTIEGLTHADGKLHPVQQAWMDKMGSQCGHCSPGMILSAVALLEKNKKPTEDEVRHALSGNLCRCGNYEKELAAVMHAAAGLPAVKESSKSLIGSRVTVLDARAKATGDAKYSADIRLPAGILYAKVLRSPVAHATFGTVDFSKLGNGLRIHATLSWEEVPNYNGDRRFMNGKARYAGDAIAAVAAETPYAAQAALEFIGVDMEIHKPVLDAEASLRGEAPAQIHQGGEVAGFAGPQKRDSHTVQFARGDVEAALKQSELTLEGRYTTQLQCHVPIEPHCCVAQWVDEQLTLWDSQQSVHNCAHTLERALGLKDGSVRVIATYLGGGFGGKCTDNEGKTLYQGIAAMLSKKAGRAVKLEYTIKELMFAEDTRNPFTFEMRTGFNKDGSITAIDCRAIQPTGGYASSGPAVCAVAGEGIVNTYKADAVRYTAWSVYTNTPVGGELRGFGHPQAVFALETHMDKVAEVLDMNPLDFRLKHCLRDGDKLLTVEGEQPPIRHSGLVECVERGAKAIDWRVKWQHPSKKTGRLRRGLGMRMSQEHSGRDVSNGVVAIRPDGKIVVPMGYGNLGTQSYNGIALLVAEALGITRAEMDTLCEFRWADSHTTAWDFVSDASRGIHCLGKAFYNAALDAREQLIATAAKMLGVPVESLTLSNGRVVNKHGGGVSFADVVRKAAPHDFTSPKYGEQDINKILNEDTGQVVLPTPKLHMHTVALIEREFKDCLVGTGFYAYNPAAKGWGAGFAEVEVDMESGRYRVIELVMAHDVGKVIHWDGVEAQIQGGGIFGLGYGTTEELLWDPVSGVPVNPALQWYRPITFVDLPKITPIVVENPDPAGPLGAKGMGENPVFNAAPAVANAVYNAAGVRVDEIPVTWARVHEALRKSGRLL